MATGNIYALLVGIDNYPKPVNPLRGCVNDVVEVEKYLRGRIPSEKLQLQTLKNEEATRLAIINGFQEHLSQASSEEDTVLFYYSGHGSQELAPPEFWEIEPDRMDETLVCWDSRTQGGWDLADKELAKLIAEVAAKKPHITIILDCCHSGSGTRDPLAETDTRWTPVDNRIRPLDTFIFSQAELANLSTKRDLENNQTGWNIPTGRHVLLAACRDHEKAKEFSGNGQHRGAFCYFLLDTLTKANGSLTYRDLYKRANTIIRNQFPDQSPQIEAQVLQDLEQPFLGGAIAPRKPYFTAYHDHKYGWAIDGGAIHGIPQPVGEETTLLALFPFDSSDEQIHDQLLQKVGQAFVKAEVTRVLPQLSVLKITEGEEKLSLDAATYKAIVTSLPLPPLGVRLEGDEAGITLVRQALQQAGGEQTPSLYVREVDGSGEVGLRVLARNGEYLITGPVDTRPLVRQIQNYTQENATKLVQRLEHISRWTTIAKLPRPAHSQIPEGAVQLQIFQGNEEILDPQIRLSYQYDRNQNKWKEPTFRVKLKNTSTLPLYCAILDLTEQYSISAEMFATGGIWLRPQGETGDEAWVLAGAELYGIVPKELYEQGVTEYKDILKLIVCTTEFDATLLTQGKLDLATTREIISASRGANRGAGTLNRLMQRAIRRDLGRKPEDEELCDDWVTSQVTITTVRPLSVSPILREGSGVPLRDGVVVQPHLGLKANARLTTVTQSTRDLGNLILPPILRENPTITESFQFTTSRGTDPGLSALELTDVDTSTIQFVTPEQPLKLLVDTSLKTEERILPIAHDGEFFIPLGWGKTQNGKTEIQIQRLPDPISKGERDIAGSIRIFFQKVVTDKLGLDFPYPILAALVKGKDGTLQPEGDLQEVKKLVAQANKIVVYIHGIVGDTRSMVATVQEKVDIEGKPQAIADLYDLVLTFDYENLNTPIQEQACKLKQRLEAVGLGRDHGKALHIIAHSMGGLVSRWFIEQEGGNKIVQHLFMLGTPNGGSPWPTVQTWATAALTIGLNSLSAVAWPAQVLSGLVGALETLMDETLVEMQPGSEFLKSLAASESPNIPYTIIAGNTSIIPLTQEKEINRIKALLQKVVHDVVEFPFFGQPNDIAATVGSITNVPEGRSPQPQVHEVACNHLVYFKNQEGLKALVKALNLS